MIELRLSYEEWGIIIACLKGKLFQLRLRVTRLEGAIRDAIEAIERGSTSAPVLEALKAALTDGDKVP